VDGEGSKREKSELGFDKEGLDFKLVYPMAKSSSSSSPFAFSKLFVFPFRFPDALDAVFPWPAREPSGKESKRAQSSSSRSTAGVEKSMRGDEPSLEAETREEGEEGGEVGGEEEEEEDEALEDKGLEEEEEEEEEVARFREGVLLKRVMAAGMCEGTSPILRLLSSL
jgi:hypothetical protein